MPQLSYFRDENTAGRPSVERAFAAVPDALRHAAEEAARRLKDLGIRHALVGGLAVGAHGAPRNTTDVDFLVGLEAFEGKGPVLVHRAGVPVRVGSVGIDLLPAEEPLLEQALERAQGDPHLIPLIDLPVLVQLKLRVLRPHDQDDVRRLIRAGADLGAIRSHLATAEPGLLSRLDYVLGRE